MTHKRKTRRHTRERRHTRKVNKRGREKKINTEPYIC